MACTGAGDGVPRAECAGAADHHRHRPLHQAAPAEPVRGEPTRARSLRGRGSCRRSPPGGWCRAGSGTGLGVDRSGAAEILRACFCAPRLEEAADTALPEAMIRLQLAPGIGPWTAAAETLQRTPVAPTHSPSAASTCPCRSATPAAAPTSRCFSCWSRTEGSATVPPSSCSGAGSRRSAAEPPGRPRSPIAYLRRGRAARRSAGVRVRRCRASRRSRRRGTR